MEAITYWPTTDFAAAIADAMRWMRTITTPEGRTLRLRSHDWHGTNVYDGDGRWIGKLHTHFTRWVGTTAPARIQSVHFGWSEHATEVECLAAFVRLYDAYMRCE